MSLLAITILFSRSCIYTANQHKTAWFFTQQFSLCPCILIVDGILVVFKNDWVLGTTINNVNSASVWY